MADVRTDQRKQHRSGGVPGTSGARVCCSVGFAGMREGRGEGEEGTRGEEGMKEDGMRGEEGRRGNERRRGNSGRRENEKRK